MTHLHIVLSLLKGVARAVTVDVLLVCAVGEMLLDMVVHYLQLVFDRCILVALLFGVDGDTSIKRDFLGKVNISLCEPNCQCYSAPFFYC